MVTQDYFRDPRQLFVGTFQLWMSVIAVRMAMLASIAWETWI
jgi:hypothetical protein